jgi:hypothetical protein
MSVDILERLVALLAAAKARASEQEPFTFAALTEAVRLLVEEHAAALPRRISGSKITKRDGQHEVEVLKNFARLIRELDRQYRHEMGELRAAAGAKVRTVYLPAKHPEEP